MLFRSYKFRPLLKEGNLLIFNVDIVKNNTDTRFIIRDIASLEKTFINNKYKFNIYTNIKNISELKDNLFQNKEDSINSIDFEYSEYKERSSDFFLSMRTRNSFLRKRFEESINSGTCSRESLRSFNSRSIWSIFCFK